MGNYEVASLVIKLVIVSDACGGVIHAANGTIQTPGFPAEYPPNKNCIWKIVAAPKSTIFLNFTHFDLEGKNVSFHEYKITRFVIRILMRPVICSSSEYFCLTDVVYCLTSPIS